jgi:hypothetical protein
MRRSIIAVSTVVALAAGGALAVPALAEGGSSKTAATASTAGGLTDTQRQELDQFLATHPKVAQRLGTRLDQWAAFAKAHPAVVDELEKVASMSPQARKSELRAWAAAHPADAKAWHELRQQIRDDRRERRENRREQRRENRKDAKPGSGGASSSPSPSSLNTT